MVGHGLGKVIRPVPVYIVISSRSGTYVITLFPARSNSIMVVFRSHSRSLVLNDVSGRPVKKKSILESRSWSHPFVAPRRKRAHPSATLTLTAAMSGRLRRIEVRSQCSREVNEFVIFRSTDLPTGRSPRRPTRVVCQLM